MKAPKILNEAPQDYREAFERLPAELAAELRVDGGRGAWFNGTDKGEDWAEIERVKARLTPEEREEAACRFDGFDDRIAAYYRA